MSSQFSPIEAVSARERGTFGFLEKKARPDYVLVIPDRVTQYLTPPSRLVRVEWC